MQHVSFARLTHTPRMARVLCARATPYCMHRANLKCTRCEPPHCMHCTSTWHALHVHVAGITHRHDALLHPCDTHLHAMRMRIQGYAPHRPKTRQLPKT